MRRRDFLALVGGVSAAWPLAARAQQATNVPRIGLLLVNSVEEEEKQGVAQGLVRGLAELGYVEGETIHIERRFAAGHLERLPALISELIDQRVTLIASAGEGVYAAARLTSAVPIVSCSAGDLVRLGFAESLAHPGKNVTGLLSIGVDIVAKRLELLKQVVPSVRRAGALLLRGYALNDQYLETLTLIARAANIEVKPFEVYDAVTYETAFSSARNASVDAFVITDAGQLYGDGKIIAALANARGLPTIGGPRMAQDGVLVGYGVDIVELFRRSAVFVDKILRGAKPGDIPLERATHFHTIVNMKTAAALRLEIPPTVLGSADEVIE